MLRLLNCLVFISPLAFGQAAGDRPAFEVTSVKPTSHSTDRGASFSVSGNRLIITRANLGFLILYAYDIDGVKPLGGPGWIWSEQQQYDVEGAAEGDAKRSPAELKLMLQTLLADRFKLVVHHETQDLSVFALVISKKGPRLGEAMPADGQPASLMNRGHISARRMSMANLAGSLRSDLGKLVLDETGLPGPYAFTLDWSPNDPGRDGDADRPSLFAALEEQLGLRLDAVKRPIEQLVIDHAEKPSGN